MQQRRRSTIFFVSQGQLIAAASRRHSGSFTLFTYSNPTYDLRAVCNLRRIFLYQGYTYVKSPYLKCDSETAAAEGVQHSTE